MEVLRACRQASLLLNSMSQPLSCCAALRVQEAASSTSASPVDHRLQALTGGSQVTELSRLHQKFLCIKVMTLVTSLAGGPYLPQADKMLNRL